MDQIEKIGSQSEVLCSHPRASILAILQHQLSLVHGRNDDSVLNVIKRQDF